VDGELPAFDERACSEGQLDVIVYATEEDFFSEIS
jgi:hypothetical protein